MCFIWAYKRIGHFFGQGEQGHVEGVDSVCPFAAAGKLHECAAEFFYAVPDFGKVGFFGGEHRRRNVAFFGFVAVQRFLCKFDGVPMEIPDGLALDLAACA